MNTETQCDSKAGYWMIMVIALLLVLPPVIAHYAMKPAQGQAKFAQLSAQ